MTHRTISFIAVLAVTLVGGRATAEVALTGLAQFSAGSTGATGTQYWTTLGGDSIFNLYVIGSYDIDGPFINSGNAATASINVPLVVGTHQFTIYGQPGGAASHAGLNLFFNGSASPSISVFAPHNSSAIVPNSNTSTRSLTGSVLAGAGTLSFSVDNLTVTLSDYLWTSPGQSLGTRDRVQAFNNVPGSGNDMIGHFTLNVVPEPSAIMLLGFAALGLLFRRLAK